MLSRTVKTPAKLNLSFDILGLRPDNYHDVETIFQTISLEDELKVSLEDAESLEFRLECENPAIRRLLPMDESNLICKAAIALLKKLSSKARYKITVQIEKKIPVGAGLAGGSSNAAGMLLALNDLLGNPVSFEDLLEIGAEIGSDVPFCLLGGTCLGRGRGEILERIPCKLDLHYCVVKPRKLSISTPWAYRTYDEYRGSIKKPDLSCAMNGLASADLEKSIAGFANVFEAPIFAAHPQLPELKTELLNAGAWYCQMTGSGPTLFALCAGREMGHHIRRRILGDDEIGYIYGTEEIILEALPPLDFRLAESLSYGARIVS